MKKHRSDSVLWSLPDDLQDQIYELRVVSRKGEEQTLRRVRWALRVHRSGIAGLVERFLKLDDFLALRDRMIGIGSVGGKTLGTPDFR